MRKIKFIILISFLFSFMSLPVYANTINDCTNKIYTEFYQKLTNYEKQRLSMFDIFIINKDLEEVPKNKNDILLGYTTYYNRTMYVSNNNENKDDVIRVLFHEFGHSIDYDFIKSTSVAVYNNKIEYFDSSHWVPKCYSESPEFIKIFEEEKNNIKLYSNEEYFLKDSSEYFAECTAIYHLQNDKLKRLAPKTYAFLYKIINQ